MKALPYIIAALMLMYAPAAFADDAKEGRGIASTPSDTQEQHLDCNSNLQPGENTNSNMNSNTANDNTHSQNGCVSTHNHHHSFFIPRTQANTGPSNTGANPAGAGR